ncbi:MAG: tandem-95 repeat protein [Thaumarchaeota archaeon]|nr:MAG: tandem-95 repeat protein [Nitrososphaerota archaeon]
MISGNVINFSLQFYNIYYVNAEDNQAPKADDQKVSVDANDNVKITLKGNDDDKGDEIKFDIIADPSNGKLDNFDKSEGTVTYVPEKDYSGDDKFKFKVNDDKGAESDTATVDISVKETSQPNGKEETGPGNSVDKSSNQTSIEQTAEARSVEEPNQAPKAFDQIVFVDQNGQIDIKLVAEDEDNDQLQFDITSDPLQGSLDNFYKEKGTVTYVPQKDYSGEDKFSFKVIDDKGAESNVGTVDVTVEVVNQPQNANEKVVNQSLGEEATQSTSSTTNQAPKADDQSIFVDSNSKAVSLAGNDADNDPIQFAIVSEPSDATLHNFDMSKGTVTYVPEKDYTGNDIFTFKVIDDKGYESNVATVNVDVKAVSTEVAVNDTEVAVNDSINQAPEALDQSNSVDKNNELNITLVGNHADNDPIQFAIVSEPSDATLHNFDMSKGTVTYVPEKDYTGNDSFTFDVADDKGEKSNVATVNVDVKEVNDTNQAPEAFNQSTNESNSNNYRYLTWSEGDEEDRFILFARSMDGGNTFSSPISLTGNVHSTVFNPKVSSSGNNVYVVWQGQSKSGNQDIFLRKSSDYGSTFGDIENLSNDPGGSGNPEVAVVGNSTHVSWEGTTPGNNFIFYTKSNDGSDFESPQKLSTNNGISYKPEIKVKHNDAADSFTYKVTDDNGAESNIATVNVNIGTVNQFPDKVDGKSVSIDSSDKTDIKLKGIDDDKDPIRYEIVSAPSDGSLKDFDPNTGTVTYVPNENDRVDVSWHNYVNGHDKILTENVDNGDKVSNFEQANNDPFKSRR